MCSVQCSEGNNKEGGGVFPCVHQMREGAFGVTVPAKALDESEPSRKTLDHSAHTVGVGITYIFTCRGCYLRNVVMRKCEGSILSIRSEL